MEIDPFISCLNLLSCLLPATANGLDAMQTVQRLTEKYQLNIYGNEQ